MSGSPTYTFRVALRFAARNSNTKHEDLIAFAHAVPWLCARADPDLHITIQAVDMTAATDIVVTLHVQPRPQSDDLLNESRKQGIKDPVATQATLDLMMWILALRRIGDAPLQSAWSQWRTSRGAPAELPETVPILLTEYSFGQPTERPASLTQNSDVLATQNVTHQSSQPAATYDGPTQTTT